MTIIPRSYRRICTIAVGVFCGISTAFADAPSILDRIRADSGPVLAVGSLKAFDQNLSQLLASIEFGAARSLREFMTVMGLGEGINMEGSAALVWPVGADLQDDIDRAVMLVPTSNADQFFTSLRAQSDGRDGDVQRIDYNNGVYYARKLDANIVAVGMTRATVVACSLDTDQLRTRLATAGKHGRNVIEHADLVLVAASDSMKPVLDLMFTPIRQGLTAVGSSTDQQFVASQLKMADALERRITVQARGAVVGLSTNALGARIDLVTPFVDGSEMYELCNTPNEATNGLRALPAHDYLLAAATNLSHQCIRSLLDDELKDAAEEAREKQPVTATRATMALAMLRSMNHAAVAVYVPDGQLLTTGALTRTLLTWTADKPSDVSETFKRMIDAAGASGEGGSSYVPNTTTLADTPVDSWSAWPSPAVPSNHNPLLTGTAPGVRGFSAVTTARGFITLGQDQGVLADAMRAGGPQQALSDDVMLTQVGEMLPANPTIRWYINLRPILSQFAPMVTTFTRAPVELPQQMPPIGGAMTMSDGAVHVGLYVPAPFLKVAATLYQAQQSTPQ